MDALLQSWEIGDRPHADAIATRRRGATMTFRRFAIAAIALGALLAAAQAAPFSGVKRTTTMSSVVEKAAYRCRWIHQRRFCRWVSIPYYRYYDTDAALRAAASSAPLP